MSSRIPLRGHVLILDPEATTRGLLARALAEAGVIVGEAGRIEEAIPAMEKRPPDILIVALKLDDEPDAGALFVRRIKTDARTKGLPVLMLAPRTRPEDALACLDAGCDDIVSKPFFVPELLARVRSHLRSRRLYEALAREKKDLDSLLELHQSVGAEQDPEAVIEGVVGVVGRILGVKRASVVLASRDPRFGYAVAASDKPGLRNLEVDLRRYPEIERVLKTGKPLVVEDASASSLFAHLAPTLKANQVKSILAVPIVVDGEAAATLLLHTRDTKKKFNQREIRLCAVAAQTAGLALRGSKLFALARGVKAG